MRNNSLDLSPYSAFRVLQFFLGLRLLQMLFLSHVAFVVPMLFGQHNHGRRPSPIFLPYDLAHVLDILL